MNKQQIYEAYVNEFNASHSPLITNDTDVEFRAINAGSVEISRSPKFWESPVIVRKLTNGQIAECITGRFSNPVALFKDEEHWREYRQPMSFNVYFEQW